MSFHFTINKQQVTGALKATGSTDLDVLHSAKDELLGLSRILRIAGMVGMVFGVLVSLTLIGAIVGIPQFLVGWWLRHHGSKNVRLANEALAEFTGSRDAPASAEPATV